MTGYPGAMAHPHRRRGRPTPPSTGGGGDDGGGGTPPPIGAGVIFGPQYTKALTKVAGNIAGINLEQEYAGANDENIQIVAKPTGAPGLAPAGNWVTRHFIGNHQLTYTGTYGAPRSELGSTNALHKVGPGDTRYVRFQFKIDWDYQKKLSWALLWQWKNDGEGSPPLGISAEFGYLNVDSQGLASEGYPRHNLGTPIQGRWHDLIFGTHFSEGSDGWIEAWFDGNPVTLAGGVSGTAGAGTRHMRKTLLTAPSRKNYPKWGGYYSKDWFGDAAPKLASTTTWFGPPIIGKTYADVAS